MTSFSQVPKPTGAIRSILNNYPYSVGLLRELIQNSDDAKATKQVLVIDRRRHHTTLGPALIAYNDGEFETSDWDALGTIFETSKSADSSKIGKYGVGFRSVFHITDTPQVLSGGVFLMFDPLLSSTSTGFKKLNVAGIVKDDLEMLPIRIVFPEQLGSSRFNGTAIRCPLRDQSSHLSDKVIRPDDIARLMSDFVAEEIDHVLLFLQHVKDIELRDINEQGLLSSTVKVSISKSSSTIIHQGAETYTVTVSLDVNGTKSDKTWRVIQRRFEQKGAMTYVARQHKLLPNVGLAIPISPTLERGTFGRLFTFLPLPLPTGFPAHVHAYFALTQSRQNLRNASEIGLGAGDLLLTEWNKLLFTGYIPHAWEELIEVLASKHELEDIFSAWPPEQQPSTTGESVYWSSLPNCVVSCALATKSKIWPVFELEQNTSAKLYSSIHELIVADTAIARQILRSLARVGLQLTCPPQYIVDFLNKPGTGANVSPTILSPETAHKHLINLTDKLKSAAKEDAIIILEYLLSGDNVHNIVGLPLIHLIGGEVVALSLLSSARQPILFTLLDDTEYDMFGACDERAIALSQLPREVANTIRTHGPEVLNVEVLTVPTIASYLTTYPGKLGSSQHLTKLDPAVVKWLLRFWVWQNTYPARDDLYRAIQHLLLLPSSRGLRRADSRLFVSRGAHPTSIKCLSSLGVPILDEGFAQSQAVQSALLARGLLDQITNIHAVLDSLPPSLGSSDNLRQADFVVILKHLAVNIPTSIQRSGSFTPEQIRRLKSLPIYPVVQFPPQSTTCVKYQSLGDDESDLTALDMDILPPFIPSIPGFTFLHLQHGTYGILDYIGSRNALRISTIVDLLRLTVDHLLTQPNHVIAATLEYMSTKSGDISLSVMEKVQDTDFVKVLSGSRRKPRDVIDPKSNLDSLYSLERDRRPLMQTATESSIVKALSSLKLLRSTLTIDIVQDRINFLASQPLSATSMDLARRLIRLMITTHLDFSKLTLTPDQQWLPTSRGLCGYTECRDKSADSPEYLFNEVLATLEPFELPVSLRRVLHWNEPVPVDVLVKQLGRILSRQGNYFEAVRDLIKHLASRYDVSDVDLASLRQITKDKKWVPTSTGHLSDTTSAIFSVPNPDSGFSHILFVDQRTKEFLQNMGCLEFPSKTTVIHKLQVLSRERPTLHNANSAIGLLRCIGSELTDNERLQLLIPDTDCILRPYSEIFFNDIGTQATFIPLTSDYLCHTLLDENLGQKLELRRLGLEFVGLATPSVDMGEKPVVTVRKTLKEYKEKQFMTEFLANAIDANATEFSLVMNYVTTDLLQPAGALSPAMAKFCTAPSLVAYNNAKFSEKDFTGICRTSVGGKQGMPETIGQFGLGALTMFHFTELAIIISNDSVLFLNPSKGHLPIRGSAALILPLQHVKRYYSSHLMPADGLFGFDIASDETFDGTIFLLPLREESHCEGSTDVISYTFWTPEQIETNILAALRESAPNCCIFTKMQRISGFSRKNNKQNECEWAFTAERLLIDKESDTGFTLTDITVKDESCSASSTWKVVTTDFQHLSVQMPEELARSTRSPRAPFAALAMLFDSPDEGNTSFNFFSALPLGISTSLPLHINASFILASDRRSIRLDDAARFETQYNKWLLTQVIPPLYFFLLAFSLRLGDQMDSNNQWWPEHHDGEDQQSRYIVQAFYENLRQCDRKLFRSDFWPTNTLTCSEAVVTHKEPLSIETTLSALQPNGLVRLSARVYQHATEMAGLPAVTPFYLRAEILRDQAPLTTLSFKVLEDVIEYLSKSEFGVFSNILDGLYVLPLDDDKSFGPIIAHSSDADYSPYFVWMPKRRQQLHNFPRKYFVHSKLTRLPHLLKLDVNVKKLDPSSIRRLIGECLNMSSPSEILPTNSNNWIEEFWTCWDEYAILGLTPDHVSDFPLVPSVFHNHSMFVSLDQCKNGSVVLSSGSSETDEGLRACLSALGLTVVRTDNEPTPDSLRSILHSPSYAKLSITGVLSGITNLQLENIPRKFAEIDANYHDAFAAWVRRNLTTPITDPAHFETARQLPIWPSVRRGTHERLRAASEIAMLPNGIPFSPAGRFMGVVVSGYYATLAPLAAQTLTLASVLDVLDLPATMDPNELTDFKEFLRHWLSLLPNSFTRAVPLPNSSRAIVLSDNLYARGPMLEAVFGQDSDHFVSPQFGDLQFILSSKHQLRSEEQLDIPNFCICAQSLIGRDDDDTAARASVLYEFYCTRLPMLVNDYDPKVWHELDEVKFIPRRMIFERRLDESENIETNLRLPETITNLPSVVSPLQIVRKEFEAVAWTQKAFPVVQPHNRILLAYPALGRATILDVIRHLKVLSSLAKTHLSSIQQTTLLHDLSETYTFLENNISLAGEDHIEELKNGGLFLNVNDPEIDDWHWDDSEHLVFETRDTEGSLRYVRSYLIPFSKMLRRIGVLEVYHPDYDFDHASDSEMKKLQTIRHGFDELRKQNSLTDVLFEVEGTPSPFEDSAPLVAHRSFLAVVSQHFRDSFCSGFLESLTASTQDPVRVHVEDYSRECVQAVLDYVYTGIQSLENASLDDLLEIMRLAEYWNINDLFADMQREIVTRKMILPSNLGLIRKAAEGVNAYNLLSICADYEERNAAFISKVLQT